jgi:serine/threonine-protein kinase HipA
MRQMPEARVLKILLNKVFVGYLTGYRDGRNLFVFDKSYINLGPSRPTLSLSFIAPNDPEATERNLEDSYQSRMKLPPFFSNLLPEGVLRDYIIKHLKVHHDHEFDILAALGESLPGAIRAVPSDDLPAAALNYQPDSILAPPNQKPIKFSLGGSQLKFSMIERGGRFSLDNGTNVWIVIPPHPTYPNVPANEYTMMKLAAALGIETPEIRIVKLDDIDLKGFTGISIPRSGTVAYAVKRYDRTDQGRIHAEDFAQVFGVYADQEYKATNYDTIGKLIFNLFPNRFDQLKEFIKRLVVNVLIGNGDAHLKNWSVIYRDGFTPQLSPAYDLVSTIHYVVDDRLALNLGGEKKFEAIDESHFNRFARRIDAPAKFVLDTVKETVATAQATWPEIIREVGLPQDIRAGLYRHWNRLSNLLRITH